VLPFYTSFFFAVQ